MKLAIFGATGTLGRHIVDKALEDGHDVTAVARRPFALERTHRRLIPLAGDAADMKTVDAAVAGQEAVLFAVGAGRKGHIRSAGTRHVIEAMRRQGVQRLVCLSSLGIGDSHAHLTLFWRYVMFGWLLKEAMADHEAQEAAVRGSGLDWTLVRPASFTDGAATGLYRHGFSPSEKGLTLKISRRDVADFMIRQLTDQTYLHRAAGLSY